MVDHEEFPELVELATNDPEVLAVVVYGSYVRGESYKDIDICLFLFPNITQSESDKRISYSSQLPNIFDIQIFADLPIFIQARVINEGVILLNKNYDSLFDIYAQTIKEYSDFLPHLNLFLEVD
ncbi:MAG TPA: nucleotidyltransferase domain-containing protein [Candidatus Lokiarchaeia archaeon]|nr:nucleotidyltransferase domain-containing protein [Candidatus Lokiarchaeia archaeon]